MSKPCHLLTTTAAGGLAALMAMPAAADDHSMFDFAGFARMGAAYDDGSEDTKTEYRFQLDASFKIVADAGLTFGGKARMRIDEDTADAGFNNPTLYASMNGAKLSVGNINGVIFNVPATYVGTGLDGNGSHGTSVYFDGFGAGGTDPAVEYSSSGAGVVDGVQLDYAMGPVAVAAFNSEDNSGVSLVYSQDGLSMGAAYQTTDVAGGTDSTLTVIGASYAINALTLGTSYAMWDGGDATVDTNKWSINASYDFGAGVSAKAFFATEDNDTVGTTTDGESYGVSISRSLGSGVTAVAGWEQNTSDVNFLSAGVTMNF